jgi:hypothetical protein
MALLAALLVLALAADAPRQEAAEIDLVALRAKQLRSEAAAQHARYVQAERIARECGDPRTRNALLRAVLEFELDEGSCAGKLLVTVDRASIRRVRSEALTAAFPGLRFFELSVLSQLYPGCEDPVSIPGPMRLTLAIDPSTGERWRLWRFGKHESFAKLLAARDVRLTSLADAERVASLMQAAVGRGGGGERYQIAPGTWRIGEHVVSGQLYWYELRTDPEGRILSGELRCGSGR